MSVVLSTGARWTEQILDGLVSSRSIAPDVAERVRAAGQAGTHVAIALATEKVVDASTAMGWLSAISGLGLVDLSAQPPDPAAVAAVPVELARAHGVLGFRLHGQRLKLACAEPPDAETIRAIAAAIELQIDELVLADPRAIDAHLHTTVAMSRPSGPADRSPGPAAAGSAGPLAAGAPVVGRPPTGAAVAARPGVTSHLKVVEPGPTAPGVTPGDWVSWRNDRMAGEAVTDLDLNELLALAVAQGASDLHLTDRFPPAVRVDGAIRPLRDFPRLQGEQIRRMIFGILPGALRERFEETKELDASHAVPGLGRFRLNVFQQRGAVGAVLRTIPDEIPSLESLGLPAVVGRLAELNKGLVLVTGATGSGKSTTLASLVEVINQSKPLHIVTVEDPIEFLHGHGRSIVNQREVGQDTRSFAESLRHALRQDPDVILVGELRDLETIAMAITAAETGHLVFATLHTQDAPQSIDRLIDVFPTNQQAQVRVQLAGALEAVVTQQLLLSSEGAGRVAVTEVMICTAAIRNLIRSAKTHQIYSLMQTGGAVGMQTMDQALAQAVGEERITEAMAKDGSRDPSQLLDYLRSPGAALRKGIQ